MSGIDEMPTFQCPICKSVAVHTSRWTGFVGYGTSGNWCYLYLDSGAKLDRLERKYLTTRSKLLKIDGIKCRSNNLVQDVRHVFTSGSAIFKNVKAAVLREDERMRRQMGIWMDE